MPNKEKDIIITNTSLHGSSYKNINTYHHHLKKRFKLRYDNKTKWQIKMYICK